MIKAILSILVCSYCVSIFASPVQMVARVGATTPISSYSPGRKQLKSVVRKNTQASENRLFIAKSNLLTEGNVKSRKVSLWNLMQPIFIVGPGRKSFVWLKQNEAYLKKINAVGVIVNVSSHHQYQELNHNFGLSLLPINADALARRLGIHHYPVLITSHFIAQKGDQNVFSS